MSAKQRPKCLPPRASLLTEIGPIGQKHDRDLKLAGENTVLSKIAGAGIVGWINEKYGVHKSITLQEGMSMREFMDELYSAC